MIAATSGGPASSSSARLRIEWARSREQTLVARARPRRATSTKSDRTGIAALCGSAAPRRKAVDRRRPPTLASAALREGLHAPSPVRVFTFACAHALRSRAASMRRRREPSLLQSAEKPLIDVKADAKTGKIIATLPKPGPDGVSARYIYLTQLETGLGSAPIDLDRAPPAAHEFWSSAASAKRSPLRSRTRNSCRALPPSRRTCATLRELTHVDGRCRQGCRTGRSGRSCRLSCTRRFRHPADRQGRGGGDFRFVPGAERGRPGVRESLSAECRVRRQANLPVRRADTPRSTTSSRQPDVHRLARHSLIRLPEPGYIRAPIPYGYTIGQQQVDFSKPLGAPIVRDLATSVPAGEGRSGGGALAGQEADRLLHRSRRAGADPRAPWSRA